ncbi:hypothetical protein E4U21_001734 [Claviceps maximensis]|nr:hypothetical protein E4U21_001734 [Claviceps maximensis]
MSPTSTLSPGTTQSPQCHAQQQQQSCPRPPASTSSSARQANDKQRHPFPIHTTRPFRPNPSSTSVAPSTAEGKAIPVDDATAKHRTLALREINNHYPSRRRNAKSTSAHSGTYAEPVIVRTYYSPAPSRHDASNRRQRQSARAGPGGSKSGGPSIGGGAARGVAFAAFTSQSSPAARSGMLSTMARACTRRKVPALEVPDHAQLPPIEAFRFRNFMSNGGAQAGTADINSDLDRIAEICARSSYSLSNQYEVHYVPHDPGSSLVGSGLQNRGPQNLLTLHGVLSDGELNLQSMKKQRRRVERKNTRAMGTLDTIMSSSRSSDEDDTKKKKSKSASELAAGARGRGVRKNQTPGPSSSLERGHVTNSPADDHLSSLERGHVTNSQADGHQQPRPLARRLSVSLALIDNSRQSGATLDTSTARVPSSALVSEPSLPQASGRQLETRTASATQFTKPRKSKPRSSSAPWAGATNTHLARGSVSSTHLRGTLGKTTVSSISGWLPWMSSTCVLSNSGGRAASSLRDLLHNAGQKGKDGTTVK